MEAGVVTYIKNMFSTVRPEWAPYYEGVILYDINKHIWVVGDNFGWIELEEGME